MVGEEIDQGKARDSENIQTKAAVIGREPSDDAIGIHDMFLLRVPARICASQAATLRKFTNTFDRRTPRVSCHVAGPCWIPGNEARHSPTLFRPQSTIRRRAEVAILVLSP